MGGHHHREDDHGHDHGHDHGRIDPSIATSDRGLWAVKWSFVGLFVTACIQLAIVLLSNSISLLADTIHNFADAATAIPLGIAFLLMRRPPAKRFSYGYGRVEDFAGIVIVLIILASAGVAAYEAIQRLLHPEPVTHLAAVIVASIIGFLGNEGVAIFRIKVGREIGSAALMADGYHARTDGWTSLAVLFGALGVYFGYPKADPVIGLLITAAILVIVWQSAKDVLLRTLDAVEPDVLEELRHSALHVDGVREVTEVRARWLGHRLVAELNVAVAPELTVDRAHAIAADIHAELMRHLKFLSRASVHIDPVGASGEHYHFPAAVDSHDHAGVRAQHHDHE
ncbi:MAG: cation transporter [Candidatus Koribacter versatilis]|uniref:Cation transporter n=1 Tax=Candidatus Korobacter versatilis TaxID=658062 RepID=A0A932A8A6_9BACT|nr:cation transporter [Candidatus Koribacter versatilis]